MKISQQWLRELVRVDLSPAKVAERLSMLGLEVEGIEDRAHMFDKVVIGKVIEKTNHPNADRLVVCSVDVGGGKLLSIVCGAPNVDVGQKVPVAMVGATVPHDQQDPEGNPFTLDRTSIRGVESNGMICSAYELGLGDDKDGILVLKENAKVGQPLVAYLGKTDVIYELEITANRGDWLSHIGVARELGASVGKRASLPRTILRESKEPARKHANIRINDKNKCRRYVARIVRNIHVHPSPEWLQDRLHAVGIRPINNIVDITNFVLLETGQPLHAFDYDWLSNKTILVQCARDGDTFTTLDGKERTLNSEVLMVCDAEKPVAVAGIMGGMNSEINEKTRNVLIESAYFDAGSIRRASKFLSLSTDASQRFERGVDIQMTLYAPERAVQLMHELAGGEILKGAIDVYPRKLGRRRVPLNVSHANSILGTQLSKAQMISMLKRLEFAPSSQSGDTVAFSVPSYRNDVIEEIDLIEEVARIHGYDKIETKTRIVIDFSKPLEAAAFADRIREYLSDAGFNEIMAMSLVDRFSAEMAGAPAISVLNPVSVGAQCLRTSLIPGALRVIQQNQSYGQKDLRLFEIGSVFLRKSDDAPENLEDVLEEERVMIVITGRHSPVFPQSASQKADFFDIKGEAQALMKRFVLDKYSFISYDSNSPLTDKGLAVEINGTYAGFLGKIKKSALEEFEIEDEVFVCELKTSVLQAARRAEKRASPLPRFPKVTRDLAFVVEETTAQESIERAIEEAAGGLLERVSLFDVFVGGRLGAGKKSLAYSLEFQPREKTLTDQEIDAMIRSIVDHVSKKLDVKLRDV